MKRVSRFKANDWYVFCDICGKRCHASETTQLHTDTGRGGLRVCRYDADRADQGLVPKNVKKERPVPFSKRDPNNTSNDYPVYDLESNIVGDITHYTYLGTSQGDIVAIEASQGILLNVDPRPTTENPFYLGDLLHISTSQGLNELIVFSQTEDVVMVSSQAKAVILPSIEEAIGDQVALVTSQGNSLGQTEYLTTSQNAEEILVIGNN